MGCCQDKEDVEQTSTLRYNLLDQQQRNESLSDTRRHNDSELAQVPRNYSQQEQLDGSYKKESQFIDQQCSFHSKYKPNDAEYDNVKQNIYQLYDLSNRLRNTEGVYKQFVRQKEDFQSLCNNYSLRTSTVKSKLKKICTSFRPARGDGNCFYTAFGYRFLEILLLQYEDYEFNRFLEQIDKIPFKINLQGFKIDDFQTESQLRRVFLYRLEQLRFIRGIQEREEQLFQYFSAFDQIDDNIDGCFYGLSTIFFRNLSYQVIQQSEMREAVYDKENILLWETECNSNEVVIEALARHLEIHIQLLYIEQNEFQLREYNQQLSKNKIILLIRPGHYNMGYS